MRNSNADRHSGQADHLLLIAEGVKAGALTATVVLAGDRRPVRLPRRGAHVLIIGDPRSVGPTQFPRSSLRKALCNCLGILITAPDGQNVQFYGAAAFVPFATQMPFALIETNAIDEWLVFAKSSGTHARINIDGEALA